MMVFRTCSRLRKILCEVDSKRRVLDGDRVDLSREDDASLFVKRIERLYGRVVDAAFYRDSILGYDGPAASLLVSLASYLDAHITLS